MIRQCILLSCCFILCGCGLGKISGSSTEFQSEDVESSDIIEATDVNENTNYFAAYADLTFLYLFGYGGGMTYGSGKYGTLDAMFKVNNESGMLFNNELLSTYGHTNYQESDRYGFALSYSYPLNVKFKTVRRGIHISRENGNSSSGWNQKQLLFFSDRKIKKTTSFQVGFQQRYFGFETYELEEYGIVDMEQYIQDLDVQYPPGYINQLLDQNYFRLFSNVTFLALGTRMTRTFASEVALKREGEIYTGMEHTIFRFGANFLFGLSSSIHTAEIPGMPSKGVKKTVDYKRLGIAFSFSGLGLTKVRALGFNTSFGFHPGHYLNAKDAFFFRLGINIGLGRLWNP